MRGIDEKLTIANTILSGKRHGFGNLIDCLQMAWASDLIQTYGMSVETALRGAWIEDEEKIKRLASMGREGFLASVKEYLGEGQPEILGVPDIKCAYCLKRKANRKFRTPRLCCKLCAVEFGLI